MPQDNFSSGEEILFEYEAHDERGKDCTYRYMTDRARKCNEVIGQKIKP
jgi:hypothetical protein